MKRDVLAVVERDTSDGSRSGRLVFSLADGLRYYRDFGVTQARVGAEVLHVHARGETRIAVSVPWRGETGWRISRYQPPEVNLGLYANTGFAAGDQVVIVEPNDNED